MKIMRPSIRVATAETRTPSTLAAVSASACFEWYRYPSHSLRVGRRRAIVGMMVLNEVSRPWYEMWMRGAVHTIDSRLDGLQAMDNPGRIMAPRQQVGAVTRDPQMAAFGNMRIVISSKVPMHEVVKRQNKKQITEMQNWFYSSLLAQKKKVRALPLCNYKISHRPRRLRYVSITYWPRV